MTIDNKVLSPNELWKRCHIAHAKLAILHEQFECMIIIRGDNVN